MAEWSIASLNGDHEVTYYEQDYPLPGPNPAVSLPDYGSFGGGIAKMSDGRFLGVAQNVRASTSGAYGYAMYATARFVEGPPASVGPYAVIYDTEDHWPAPDRFAGMQGAYQQILPLGDHAVVAFWSDGHFNNTGLEERFDIILLDVSGSTPSVVDATSLTSMLDQNAINEPDIGKVDDDVFIVWDNPFDGGQHLEARAYRVGPAGLIPGPLYTQPWSSSEPVSYSTGIVGAAGKFLVYYEETIPGVADMIAWLGSVDPTTLAISRDAFVGIPNVAGRWPGNAAINISMTAKLPEPRIGFVAGNYYADLFEIERIDDTAQISAYRLEPTQGDAGFHFNLGHSFPVAYDSAGVAHAFYYRYLASGVTMEFLHVIDVFGSSPTVEVITDATWPAVAEEFALHGEFGYPAAMTADFASDGTLVLHMNAADSFGEVDPYYEGGTWGQQRNPPWGQYFVTMLGGAPEIVAGPLGSRRRFAPARH